jgi:hypothetical protein
MITQLLAMIVAMTAICLLSGLRYLFMAREANRQRYYRASVVRCVDAGWDAQPDNSSNSGSDSQATTTLPRMPATDLFEWPAELDLEAASRGRLPENINYEHPELKHALRIGQLARRSRR